MSINNVKSNLIIFHKVKENETIEQIAKIYNINVQLLKYENKIDEVFAGDLLFIPQQNQNIYIVQPTDTLPSIAKKLNITVEQLKQKNNCLNIFIGQKLMY